MDFELHGDVERVDAEKVDEESHGRVVGGSKGTEEFTEAREVVGNAEHNAGFVFG